VTVPVVILAAVMTGSSLGVKVIGLPRQIAANRRRRTAPHSMRWFAALGVASYASQALWCALQGDWVLGAVNIAGVTVAAALGWQVLRYPDAG
jgi:hypothetical protein